MSSLSPTASQAPRRPRAAGFALVDVLLAGAVLLIAVLGHVASTVAQHDLSRTERERSAALRTAGRLLEQLRADEDWSGLYARLHLYQTRAGTLGDATALLADGRRTYPPSTYLPGFEAPEGFTVLLEVPHTVDPLTGVGALREDADAPDLLLPADLNGDGRIDAAPRDGDYRFLPVRCTFRWRFEGQRRVQQTRIVVWMRRPS